MKSLRRARATSDPPPSEQPSSSSSSSSSSSWIHLRTLVIVASSPVPDRGGLKSPWSRRKRKHALSYQQWKGLFTVEGKLRDGGVKFLKKVRSGGIDPSIRAEVWPFLLGLYDLTSSADERNDVTMKNRKEYLELRIQCKGLLETAAEGKKLKIGDEVNGIDSPSVNKASDSPYSGDMLSTIDTLSIEEGNTNLSNPELPVFDEVCASITCNTEEYKNGTVHANTSSGAGSCSMEEYKNGTVHANTSSGAGSCSTEEYNNGIVHANTSPGESESSDADSSFEEPENMEKFSTIKEIEESQKTPVFGNVSSPKDDSSNLKRSIEDFAIWQRIIRLDAIRANAEWIPYSPTQAAVSEENALEYAVAVGLKDYDHLEPCRIYHAARLVAVLEAYALYDPEIGYCQGMSDLLSPILAIMEEDHSAFWCFVGFMKKARHNFRLDEVGIRRQLSMVSKIIKYKDSHLYKHLEKLQAEDCFFVYRMVVVVFRRELSFEQTLCLWEVMWADQAAIRAGKSKSAWARIRLRDAPPPTDDLLLYAIAASVLQRRKLIIERYSSMDEILRECNSMAGQLDVWKLLNDAHDLVVTLHDKI